MVAVPARPEFKENIPMRRPILVLASLALAGTVGGRAMALDPATYQLRTAGDLVAIAEDIVDGVFGALLDGVANRIFELRRHVARDGLGVAVVVDSEDLRTDRGADAVPGTAIRVDPGLHRAARSTGVNSRFSWVRPRRM